MLYFRGETGSPHVQNNQEPHQHQHQHQHPIQFKKEILVVALVVPGDTRL